MVEYHDIIWQVIRIVLDAGVEVLDVYGTDFETHLKADQTPVTEADLRANTLITEKLSQLEVPGAGILGVIAEESSDPPYEVRKDWQQFWLVDPVDGTKEFVNRNGEFTVNIGLIEGQEPVLGVVLAPAKNLLYVGARAWGCKETRLRRRLADKPDKSR